MLLERFTATIKKQSFRHFIPNILTVTKQRGKMNNQNALYANNIPFGMTYRSDLQGDGHSTEIKVYYRHDTDTWTIGAIAISRNDVNDILNDQDAHPSFHMALQTAPEDFQANVRVQEMAAAVVACLEGAHPNHLGVMAEELLTTSPEESVVDNNIQPPVVAGDDINENVDVLGDQDNAQGEL